MKTILLVGNHGHRPQHIIKDGISFPVQLFI